MKTKLQSTLLAFILFTSFAISKTVTISTTGSFTFSPDSISITDEDTVNFVIGSGHNATEVSETTWNNSGSTPLAGGFAKSSTGTVSKLSAGIHYYVCTPHASMGMKGKIVVASTVGIKRISSLIPNRFYPNPTKNNFTIELTGNEKSIKIYNLVGSVIAEYTNLNEGKFVIDALENKPIGAYFVAITTKESIVNFKVVKE